MRFRAVFCHVCLFSVRCLVLFRFLFLAAAFCCFGSCCACVSLLLVGGAGGRCSVFVLPVSLYFGFSVAGCGVVFSSGAVGSSRGVVALVVSLGWLLGLALVCSQVAIASIKSHDKGHVKGHDKGLFKVLRSRASASPRPSPPTTP